MYRSSWMRAPVARARTAVRLALGLGCLALAGCVETNSELTASASAPVRVTARAGVSPSGAPLAIASIEGAPRSVTQAFVERTRSAAAGLDVRITDLRDAKYIVRGYLDAQPAAQGIVVSYVWDVFDARKARVQRLEDGIAVKGSDADPWSVVDDKTLTDLATKSAGDLAALLTNMPEAAAASRNPPPAAPAPAPRVAAGPAPARVADAASLR